MASESCLRDEMHSDYSDIGRDGKLSHGGDDNYEVSSKQNGINVLTEHEPVWSQFAKSATEMIQDLKLECAFNCCNITLRNITQPE